MHRLNLTLILIMISLVNSFGQKKEQPKDASLGYNISGGFRLGTTPGISIKKIISASASIQGILHTRNKGFLVTGLFEKHKQAFEVPNFNWFYGLGGHAGVYQGRSIYDDDEKFSKESEFNFGVDFVIGLEYQIKEIPFTIGVDVKPFIDIIGTTWYFFDSAFSIRYIIK